MSERTMVERNRAIREAAERYEAARGDGEVGEGRGVSFTKTGRAFLAQEAARRPFGEPMGPLHTLDAIITRIEAEARRQGRDSVLEAPEKWGLKHDLDRPFAGHWLDLDKWRDRLLRRLGLIRE